MRVEPKISNVTSFWHGIAKDSPFRCRTRSRTFARKHTNIAHFAFNAIWQQVPIHARSVHLQITNGRVGACLLVFLVLILGVSFVLVFTNSTFQSFHKLSSSAGRSPRRESRFQHRGQITVHFRTTGSALLSPIVSRRRAVVFEHWTNHSSL